MSLWQIELRGAGRRLRNRIDSFWRPRSVFLTPAGRSVADMITAFDIWCANNPGTACELALSSLLVRTCIAPTPLPAEDLAAYATRQFIHYFGDPQGTDGSEEWTVAVSHDQTVPIACGVPRHLVNQLSDRARSHSVRIISIHPWWVRGVAKALLHVDHVIAREPGAVTNAEATAGRLRRVWTEPSFDAVEANDAAMTGSPSSASTMSLWSQDDPIPMACDTAIVAKIIRGEMNAPRPSAPETVANHGTHERQRMASR